MRTDTRPDLTGEQVRQLREARGWTQARLASETGLSVRTIGNFERGSHEVHGAGRRRLLAALTEEGSGDDARSQWDEDVRLFGDILCSFLQALPEAERLPEMTALLADIGRRRSLRSS